MYVYPKHEPNPQSDVTTCSSSIFINYLKWYNAKQGEWFLGNHLTRYEVIALVGTQTTWSCVNWKSFLRIGCSKVEFIYDWALSRKPSYLRWRYRSMVQELHMSPKLSKYMFVPSKDTIKMRSAPYSEIYKIWIIWKICFASYN